MASSDQGDSVARNPRRDQPTTGPSRVAGDDPADAIHEKETFFGELATSPGAASRAAGSVADVDEFSAFWSSLA